MADPTNHGTASRSGGSGDIIVASFTSAVDEFLLYGISTSGDPGVTPDTPTGHGTWVEIPTSEQAGIRFGLTLWGCISLGATATVVVSNSTTGSMGGGIVGKTDVDVSGGVISAIIQKVQNNGYSTTPTGTFGSTPTKTTIHFWGNTGNTLTDDNTVLDTVAYDYGGRTWSSGYAAGGDQTPTATQVGVRTWAMRAVELKEAAAGVTVDVPAGSLTLTGQAPTVIAGNPVDVEVPVGALNLTGFVPTALAPETVDVPTGSLSLTGLEPTVIAPNTVDVPTGSLTLTGFNPAVIAPEAVDVPAGSLLLNGFAPAVIAGSTVDIPAGEMDLTGFDPTVIAPNNIEVPTGSLLLNGFAPIVDLGDVEILVGTGTLTLTGFTPKVIEGESPDIFVSVIGRIDDTPQNVRGTITASGLNVDGTIDDTPLSVIGRIDGNGQSVGGNF